MAVFGRMQVVLHDRHSHTGRGWDLEFLENVERITTMYTRVQVCSYYSYQVQIWNLHKVVPTTNGHIEWSHHN